MTVTEIKSQIRWGTTIYLSCRQFICPDGYKISVIKQDELATKEQMDKLLIKMVQNYMSGLKN